jgi:hypothetical protein
MRAMAAAKLPFGAPDEPRHCENPGSNTLLWMCKPVVAIRKFYNYELRHEGENEFRGPRIGCSDHLTHSSNSLK